MMTPIRPALPDLAARPGGVSPSAGGDARAAFFRAALSATGAASPTASAAPQTAPAVRPVPVETHEAARPDPLSRPGRLLDIRV